MASVAEYIRSHHDEIVARWAEEAGRLASGRDLDAPELRNIMPTYIAALSEPVGSDRREGRSRLIARHLAGRIREGFLLDEMVEEIAILGRCISALWAGAPPSERPDAADVERLYRELGMASSEIADAFLQHMRDDEQTEKRYLRRLQALASEVSRDDAGGTPEGPLSTLLALVMEAMDAQTAALLVLGPTPGSLLTVATAGVARDALAGYSTSLDAPSFAAAIASRALEPTAVVDVFTTELEVCDALRASGIHALLGVRLPAYEPLRGVMYVGVRERRAFAPRELRRIEAMGEQLARHLEDAARYTELRAAIAERDAERALRDRFVSVLAHDLRGPLQTAKLGASLLASDPARLGTLRDVPGRISRSIARADRMVRDLLDALLIRAGRPLPLAVAECDLVEIAREVVEELDPPAARRVSLREEGPVRGLWSGDDVRRAIWNLTTNALKYGAPGEPVEVAVLRRAGGAEVSVHNVGNEIPAGDQAQLFKPFSQAGAGADGRHGWGLGLTLVQGCAAAHGGDVVLDSAPGGGTTFTVRLPEGAAPARVDRPE